MCHLLLLSSLCDTFPAPAAGDLTYFHRWIDASNLIDLFMLSLDYALSVLGLSGHTAGPKLPHLTDLVQRGDRRGHSAIRRHFLVRSGGSGYCIRGVCCVGMGSKPPLRSLRAYLTGIFHLGGSARLLAPTGQEKGLCR
jgi:hypothetical protein